MTDSCGPHCQCWNQGTIAFTRRDFLAAAAAGTAAVSLSCAGPWVRESGRTVPLSKSGEFPGHPLTPPRTYSGEHLSAVAMPIGGIGTGTIWIDGKGRLSVWQIFNNHTETRVPDSFLAVRAKTAGGEPIVRVLQTEAVPGFTPMESLEFEGGYPIARLRFSDRDFPLEVILEAWNPFIPMDAERSSMPCALFRVTARNTRPLPVEFAAIACLQNAVGCEGQPPAEGFRHPLYGYNINRAVVDDTRATVVMSRAQIPPEPGPFKLRDQRGREVPETPLAWLDHARGMADAARSEEETRLIVLMSRVLDKGGVAVVCGAETSFLMDLNTDAAKRDADDSLIVFEDFEKENYGRWTVSGTAFGSAPARGTTPGQGTVAGFLGRRLVNTFQPDDGPTGELISPPFTINRRYISFVIGGGNHPGETCINLKIDGHIVRTATGTDEEALKLTLWDVEEFRGKEAFIEIIDRSSGGWGHINVDHILFADSPPNHLYSMQAPMARAAFLLQLAFDSAEPAEIADAAAILKRELPGGGPLPEWTIKQYTRVAGFRSLSVRQPDVIAALPNGDPLIVSCRAGEAVLCLCLAPDLPWSWAERLFQYALGPKMERGLRLVSGSPREGALAVSAFNPGALALAEWSDAAALAEEFAQSGRVSGGESASLTPEGETRNGAVCSSVTIPTGETRTLEFGIAWHFPNVDRFGHPGNYYSRHFPDADAVLGAAGRDLDALWDRTSLYHRTVYESNLPEEFIDAFTSQSVILRGPTCYWCEDGYFAGFEGCYQCCPLNCTHVWNYAHTHARLFPEIGRNLRFSDLITHLLPSGETSHRQHAPHGAFIDGHCAVIAATFREYQMSADAGFLVKVWPNLKKAVDWLIEKIDPDHDGVPSGRQANTYDCDVSGANTFIGSQYLAALAAAEQMAHVMGEPDAARRWSGMREAGMRNQPEQLWNGEYFIQIPEDPQPGRGLIHNYNTGCHSDQLLGQWWAHQLALGRLYPGEQIESALRAVVKYNFRPDFKGLWQTPRRFVNDDEGGLLMCTWPQNDRPNPFIIYADEIWTGVEYATAGLLIHEGMMDEARAIVRIARSRYDGRIRPEINSGPGGNPFNELECGKFYARALASGSLLIASQGLVLDGPAGVLGFKPRWQPEDHRSFFSAPDSWGLFIQKRDQSSQFERIEFRHGSFLLTELVFEVADDALVQEVQVRIGRSSIKAITSTMQNEVRIVLSRPRRVMEGESVEVLLDLQTG